MFSNDINEILAYKLLDLIMKKCRKLVMVLRLYTGLETSLKDELWAPQGVPTIKID